MTLGLHVVADIPDKFLRVLGHKSRIPTSHATCVEDIVVKMLKYGKVQMSPKMLKQASLESWYYYWTLFCTYMGVLT